MFHKPGAGNYRTAVAETRIDRTRHGEIHGRHILQAGMRRPGQIEMLVVGRRFVAKQQIIAKDKTHRPGHIVHDRARSIEIRVIADKQALRRRVEQNEALHRLHPGYIGQWEFL